MDIEVAFLELPRGCVRGGPLSPLLFNLVADALSALLDKEVRKKHITRVLADLKPGGILHIQYVDDTIIMTDGSE